MRTCIVTTTYLVPDERFKKTEKFLDYYLAKTDYHIYVLDNSSPAEELKRLRDKYETTDSARVTIVSLKPHYDRPSHLDYKYLWRAVFFLSSFFVYYDKIIYMDNDFYILSDKMFKYIEEIKSGWTTFYSAHYGFPETGCHVLTECDEYNDFVDMEMDDFVNKYNGKIMEDVLPVTHVERSMIGDRYGELPNKPDKNTVDYWAQADVKDEFNV